jgi:hypothetical protein
LIAQTSMQATPFLNLSSSFIPQKKSPVNCHFKYNTKLARYGTLHDTGRYVTAILGDQSPQSIHTDAYRILTTLQRTRSLTLCTATDDQS